MSTLSLYDEIQEIRALYPESLSAVMPALQLAQERSGGWLPEEAFREVADALDLTPAYCLSIASSAESSPSPFVRSSQILFWSTIASYSSIAFGIFLHHSRACA